MPIRYLDRKDAIRAELLRCAQSRETIYYSDLGKKVGMPNQGPWRPILDVISKEETSRGEPDITFLVINKQHDCSGQVGFTPAKPPTAKQREQATRAIQAVFARYGR